MWRFGTTFGIKPGAGAWSLISASPMTGLGQAATRNKTGACRTLKIWMRRCVLLRSVKIAAYQQQYRDNQNISFLPAIVSTSPVTRNAAALAAASPTLLFRPT